MNRQTDIHLVLRSDRSGVALITVLSLLALVTVLVVAFFSLARIEYVSANRYADNLYARSLSEAATNVVIDQIWRATSGPGAAAEGAAPAPAQTWISQPGALRRYSGDGSFAGGFKLYSDSAMAVNSEGDLTDDSPPTNWNLQTLQYVDLNEPVLRSDETGPLVYFPIADPRAFYDDPETELDDRIEGFSYTDSPEGGENPIAGVVTPESADDPTELRLPMPVEWLYALLDGTIGHLNDEGTFVPEGLVTPDNPIVGRVAFWADDETTKLNINTASEATAWLPPTVYHDLSARFARSQPYAYEFQRYPGHPATTSLSPVLFPNAKLNYLDVYDNTELAREAHRVKNRIYNIIPKMLAGGSNAGTRNITPYTGLSQEDLDDLSWGGNPGPDGDARRTTKEKRRGRRLYATLDELFLRPNRLPNRFPGFDEDDNELDLNSVTPEVIERGKFFLTAASRAPETNIFNLPRISMWPLHEETRDEETQTADGDEVEFRTAFDQLIGFSSTVNKAPYHFLRRNADDPTEDITLERNVELLDYLGVLTSSPVPGWGGSFSSSEKYGKKNEREQILTEIFDYTRMLNLHDDTLPDAVRRHKDKPQNRPPPPKEGTFGPFTNPRFATIPNKTADLDALNELNAFPGHGQVTPSYIESDDTKGFGRFYTISEVALHFIANADAGDGNTYRNGGVGWSNYPPLSSDKIKKVRDAIDQDDEPSIPPELRHLEFPKAVQRAIPGKTNNYTHPPRFGGAGANWNHALPRNTPLPEGKKLIQAAFLLEFFCPAAGWTQIVNDFHVRISGLDNIDLNGENLFLYNEVEIPSFRGIGTYSGGSNRGGPVGYRGFLAGRSVEDRAPLQKNGKGNNKNWDGGAQADHGNRRSWPLVSDFIEVDRDADMELSIGGPITIEIHSGSRKNGSGDYIDNLVQTIEIEFEDATLRPPNLVNRPANRAADKPVDEQSKEAWSFHKNGSARRSRSAKAEDVDVEGVPNPRNFSAPFVKGRFHNVHTNDGYNFIRSEDVIQSMIPRHGDYRLIAARREVPLEIEGKRVFVPHRNYGSKRLAHNLVSAQNTRTGPGFDYGDGKGANGGSADTDFPRLAKDATYNRGRWPDFPAFEEAATAAHRYGDFDNGISNLTDGAYINKPDDGNNYVQKWGDVPYLDHHNAAESTGSTFFSPNRQVPSPGIYGSLPTGVKRDIPWLTLLFRPPILAGGLKHPGAKSPPDHLFMDLFWMPVVEPYAISEPFSTAGKVNLNYEMLPFGHITRATALHGVMKGEIMRCIPTDAGERYLNASDDAGIKNGASRTRKKVGGAWESTLADDDDWFYRINLEKTLDQFEKKFARGEAFKTASEICDIHLVPEAPDGGTQIEGTDSAMRSFWTAHALTGDNSRELPYTTIYPRLTTRSNTFRVHMRAQALRIAQTGEPGTLEADRIEVASEYRGSTLIERYIDPSDPNIPDYAESKSPLQEPPLDSFYRVRVINSKRFDP